MTSYELKYEVMLRNCNNLAILHTKLAWEVKLNSRNLAKIFLATKAELWVIEIMAKAYHKILAL